jgi:hypothetical protein
MPMLACSVVATCALAAIQTHVATIAVHDRDGATLVSKRLGSTADEGPQSLLDRLGAEVHHMFAQRPDLVLTIVQDGAPELWNLVDEWLDRSDTAIDRICRHLNELADHQLLGKTEGDPMPAYWAGVARPTITGERTQIAWGHLGYLDRHRAYLRARVAAEELAVARRLAHVWPHRRA